MGNGVAKAGTRFGGLPDSWNLSHPEDVADVARCYRQAGSRVILTNTFRANPISLAGHGLADRCAEINRAGVEISKKAAGGALVFASIGPSGKLLAAGDVTEEELIGGLLRAGASAGVRRSGCAAVGDIQRAGRSPHRSANGQDDRSTCDRLLRVRHG